MAQAEVIAYVTLHTIGAGQFNFGNASHIKIR